jgi:acyl-[acyl-carrier-protein]-phospholipid O-acyltransferase/long-chain-fatty-acid--[acyl-carrier-protein] ligase
MLFRLTKFTLGLLLRLLYRVEVRGRDNFYKAGDRVLVVANHVSLLDALLLAVFLPGKLGYAIDTSVARRWWVRPFLGLVQFCPMDTANPMSLKRLIDFLEQDQKALIFPEGRMSVTGSLMKIYAGPGMVADRSGATILPVRIDGAQYSYFTHLKGLVRRRWFPKIVITCLPPDKMQLPDGLSGRARREAARRHITRLMREMLFKTEQYHTTLFDAVLMARRQNGGRFRIVEDINRKSLSYDQLLLRAFLLGSRIRNEVRNHEPVGILLPTSIANLALILGLHAHGRVPALLNFGAGLRALQACINAAQIRVVYTSRKFIREGKLEYLVDNLLEDVEVRYLEDVAAQISIARKLSMWLLARFPRLYYRRHGGQRSPDDAAVILFTSGSEGLPKGVVLSHINILANQKQLITSIDFNRSDVLLNVLPMFHSFGLTAGAILPLLSGIPFFLYPSPLHYREIPEIAYAINASILFGTNTFFTGYAHYADDYDFARLRYVFAGAEPLTPQTQQLWMQRFGIRILQGYGVTETSPVLSANTSLEQRQDSVGTFVPGVEYYLADFEDNTKGKRLQVRGPNVMKGYLFADNPGVLVPPSADLGAGWHDTGDIAEIDQDGFIFIRGRARRFAKIGGEMVSLAVVEDLVRQVWPDTLHAVVSCPDSSKGEILVLVTEHRTAERAELVVMAKKHGLNELYIPRKILSIHCLPVLSTGKVDYPSIQEHVEKVLT